VSPARRGPVPATERLRRLLAVLPWLMRHGRSRLDEVAARFAVPPEELVRDLELAAMCGLPPYTDQLVDLYVEDGWIEVGVPRLFTNPRRFTAEEGFALLAAGRAALAVPGADGDGPLASAMEKLERALGAQAALAVTVDEPAALATVQRAVADAQRLRVTYFSAWRDELTEREIDPLAVFMAAGHWYLVADDHRAGAERLFRVDRIEAAESTGATFTPRPVTVPATVEPAASDDAVSALVVLPASARWAVESYPVDEVVELADGRLQVRLLATGTRFLERLVLRAGPGAEVLEPAEWSGLGRRAAERLLARYG